MITVNSHETPEWQPPDGLGYSSMRETEFTAGGIAALVTVGVLALGGIVLGAFLATLGARESRDLRALAEKGVVADAEVTRVWRSGKNDERRVAYRFTAAGRDYEHSLKAPRNIWDSLQPGARLPVRYLANNPAVNRAEEWVNAPIPVWAAFLAAFGVIAPTGMLVWVVRRQVRLLTEGRPAPGTVLRYSRGQHGTVRVHYEFKLPNGAAQKGRSECGRRRLPDGVRLCVLYDPENPRCNAAYPFTMVRLANLRRPAKKPY
jgi:hypothetical protein